MVNEVTFRIEQSELQRIKRVLALPDFYIPVEAVRKTVWQSYGEYPDGYSAYVGISRSQLHYWLDVVISDPDGVAIGAEQVMDPERFTREFSCYSEDDDCYDVKIVEG